MAKGISAAKRYRVLERDNFACRYCGAPAPSAHLVMDHVVPKRHGGRDYPENLVSACESCNAGKSDKLPTPELIASVKEAQRSYDSRSRNATACQFCPNTAYFDHAATTRPVCGICASVFAAGAMFARGELP